MCRNQKKDSILKIVAITSTVVLSILAVGAIAYKLFTKYFKITFECDSNCENCAEGCCDAVSETDCDCCEDSDFEVEVTESADEAAE